MSLLALAGARLYVDPEREPFENGVLLVDGARVAAVGNSADIRVPIDAQIIDCSAATVVAGFWNCHVHFTERKWRDAESLPAAELSAELQDFLRYGFTSVFDLSSSRPNTRAIERRIESGELDGPRILTTGEGMVPAGAQPPDAVTRMMGWMQVELPQVREAGEAAATAQRLIDEGVDAIKIFASGQRAVRTATLPEEALRAVVQVARAFGKPVFLHPNRSDDLARAVNARVDVIAHTIPSAPLAGDDLKKMADAGIALIPTLMLWKHLMRHDRSSTTQRVVETAVDQLALFRSAGGTVLFGTDYGVADADPAEEYALMGQAGMGFAEILASLTTQPARRFGESPQLGTLAAGSPADIAVLRGDASRGPAIFSDVLLTIRAGKIVSR